ncbi:MAG: DNA-processing protein DprA [Nocardioidaceae bacterium]
MSDRIARSALCRLGEPGTTKLSGLVGELGAEKVYDLLANEREVTGLSTDVALRLRGLDPERELADAARRGIRFICPGDDEWPSRINDLDRAGEVHDRGGQPLGLWARGPLRLDEACARSLAVVGSRSATTYGVEVAMSIAADVADTGVTVVSGAAFGIDQAAHRGALAGRGPTVAVLACGVDRAYPAAHRSLLEYIAETGLVVSELPPGCSPTRIRFLARNRLIAALAIGTVVVEAAARSGALNTATWTTRLGRILMGVPGPVTSAPSEGVHELLRGGSATLVTRGADVLELVSASGTHLTAPVRGERRPHDVLTVLDLQVFDAVPVVRSAPAGSIARTAGLGAVAVGEAITRLAEAGLVVAEGPNWRRADDARDPPGP